MTDGAETQPPSTELVQISAGVTIDLGLGEFIARVAGEPLERVGDILADVLGLVRLQLAIPFVNHARRKLKKAGFEVADVGPIDLSTLFPILESGSIASHSTMQERWANLLANAAVRGDAISPGFSNILRQLDPLDASMLDAMHDDPACRAPVAWDIDGDPETSAWPAARFAQALDDVELGMPLSARLDNLVRLGVCFNPTEAGMSFSTSPMRDRVLLTHLGVAFIAACQPPHLPATSG